MTCGVLQGSTSTFTYLHKWSNISTLLFIILFADDTNIFLQGKKIDDLVKQNNLELSKM